jgi:hypothetical protein
MISPTRTEDILNRFPIVDTSDPDEMRHALFSTYGATRFELPDPAGFSARGNYVQTDDLGIGFCAYGAKTIVDFPEANYVRLQIGLKGSASTVIDGKRSGIGGFQGCITNAGRAASLTFDTDYEQIVLRISRNSLQRKLGLILGAAPKSDMVFDASTDLAHQHGQSLFQLIMFFAGQLNSSTAGLPPLALRQLQQAISSTFLYANRHSLSALLEADPKDTAPRAISLSPRNILRQIGRRTLRSKDWSN